MSAEPVARVAARAVVLNAAGQVLLQHMNSDAGHSWITPGGGLEPGETHEQAVLRELREEVGLRLPEAGPWVWLRTAEFTFRGVPYRQRERFFLVRAELSEFDESGLEDAEVGVVLGHRWWSVEEIEASTGTVFWPSRLSLFLRPLIEGRLPASPLDVGE